MMHTFNAQTIRYVINVCKQKDDVHLVQLALYAKHTMTEHSCQHCAIQTCNRVAASCGDHNQTNRTGMDSVIQHHLTFDCSS